MEIIHLILGKANPQRMNGVNKVVHELSTHQAKAGEQVSVWGITDNLFHDYPERCYTTILFPAKKYSFAIHLSLKKAIKEMRGRAVFHLHGGFIPAMFRIAMYLKKCKIPFVFTPHGSYNTIAMQKSSIRKKIYFELIEKRLLNCASVIHSLGKSEVDGLQLIYPNNKTRLIPYGFESMGTTVPPATDGYFIIGYCGRIDIYTKGLAELFLAFKLFRATHPTAHLWIIGNGEEMATLLELTEALQLTNSVIFHGARYGEEKYRLLRQCHVFAAPSRNEGLPTAVLEASALGIPCLVTEATNTGDSIRAFGAGEVINETEQWAIMQGLSKLYDRIVNQHQLPELAENARLMISTEYNWNSIVNRFHQLYQ